MTKVIFTLLFSLLALSSCCTKKKCGSGFAELTFNGFALGEIDTICQITNGDTVYEFPGISQDSVFTYKLRQNGAVQTGVITVWIPGAEKAYEFSNFRYEKRNCNECYPVGHDKYNAYKGCDMNGVPYSGEPIDVYR